MGKVEMVYRVVLIKRRARSNNKAAERGSGNGRTAGSLPGATGGLTLL